MLSTFFDENPLVQYLNPSHSLDFFPPHSQPNSYIHPPVGSPSIVDRADKKISGILPPFLSPPPPALCFTPPLSFSEFPRSSNTESHSRFESFYLLQLFFFSSVKSRRPEALPFFITRTVPLPATCVLLLGDVSFLSPFLFYPSFFFPSRSFLCCVVPIRNQTSNLASRRLPLATLGSGKLPRLSVLLRCFPFFLRPP